MKSPFVSKINLHAEGGKKRPFKILNLLSVKSHGCLYDISELISLFGSGKEHGLLNQENLHAHPSSCIHFLSRWPWINTFLTLFFLIYKFCNLSSRTTVMIKCISRRNNLAGKSNKYYFPSVRTLQPKTRGAHMQFHKLNPLLLTEENAYPRLCGAFNNRIVRKNLFQELGFGWVIWGEV